MKELKTFRDLDWSRKTPCSDCPFLKTTPLHEGICHGLQAKFEAIEENNFAHTCHKTDNREGCDGPRNFKGEKPQHCAGAILMLIKTGKGADLQMPLLRAMDAGLIDIKDMTRRAKRDKRVFTMMGMLRAYTKWLQTFYGRRDE